MSAVVRQRRIRVVITPWIRSISWNRRRANPLVFGRQTPLVACGRAQPVAVCFSVLQAYAGYWKPGPAQPQNIGISRFLRAWLQVRRRLPIPILGEAIEFGIRNRVLSHQECFCIRGLYCDCLRATLWPLRHKFESVLNGAKAHIRVSGQTMIDETLPGVVPVAKRQSIRRVCGHSSKLRDPGLGFSARMTVGAQHRLGVRRRRRLAAGLAVSVATGMFGVFLVAHHPAAPDAPPPNVQNRPLERDPRPEPPRPEPATDDDLTALAQLADVDSASRVSADWDSIEQPLEPYKKLVKGDVP